MADVLDDLFGSDSDDNTTQQVENTTTSPFAATALSRFHDTAKELIEATLDATCAGLSAHGMAASAADLQFSASHVVAGDHLGEAKMVAMRNDAVLWDSLQKHKSWPHECMREAFIATQVVLAWDEIKSCNHGAAAAATAAVRAIRNLDRAFVMCGRSELVALVACVESHVPKHNAHANGLTLLPSRQDAAFASPDKMTLIAAAGGIARLVGPSALDVAAEFEASYFRKQVPVVLADGTLTKGWQALESWRDLHALVSEHGHRIVPVEVGRHSHDKQQQQQNNSADDDWRECFLTLGEFADTFLRPSMDRYAADLAAEERGALPPAPAVGYIAQHGLFEQIPKLLRDIKQPISLASRCNGGHGLTKVSTWLGTHGTVTPLHFDSYDNFLVQVAGAKYVRLYAIDQTPFLHADDAGAGGSLAQSNISPVDVERPDLARFPRFAEATHTDVVMLPGDALFIPKGVWHYVRSLSPSFSVNFWF